mmetsp:Transcript_91770/g.137435  ORF Transcript_91770/g.137435 Transcript_91770/m.137435 type:complete len:219 (+) Transcript_91770:461-1117(+)
MSNKVCAELACAQVPDLDELVPARGHDEGHLSRGREDDAAHPVRVHVLVDGVLALRQGVPELDRPVPAARDDLAVVPGEGHAVHVLRVALEGPHRGAGVQVPEPHGLVPGAGQRELAVRGEHHAGHGLAVAREQLPRVADGLALRGELPDHELLVARGGDHEVALFVGRGDARDPAAVAREETAVLQGVHVCLGEVLGAEWSGGLARLAGAVEPRSSP